MHTELSGAQDVSKHESVKKNVHIVWYVSKRIVSLHGERGVGHALSLNQSTHTNLTLKPYKAT